MLPSQLGELYKGKIIYELVHVHGCFWFYLLDFLAEIVEGVDGFGWEVEESLELCA